MAMTQMPDESGIQIPTIKQTKSFSFVTPNQ